jgi:hypothetical protein
MIPCNLLPDKLLERYKQWANDSSQKDKYTYSWDSSTELRKLDGTKVLFSNELKCVINSDLSHSLQNGLVFAKKNKGFTFRLLAKKNFWIEERSDVKIIMYKVTNDWNGLGSIPICCARGPVPYQVAVDICKHTKFRLATHCTSRNDLIKQLTSLEDKPATVLEKCLAYVLSGDVNTHKTIGSIIPCRAQANSSSYKVCTCDIDLASNDLARNVKRKLKKFVKGHENDK